MPNGEQVRIIERTNDKWVKVEYNGQTGYMASELVDQGNTRKNNSDNQPRKKNNSNNNSSANRNNNQKNNSRRNNNSNSSGSTDKRFGIGVRLGDPAGISFKKYNSNNSAWEFNLGRSFRWGYDYNRNFYHYDGFDKDRYEFKDYYNPSSTALQAHYLKHYDLSNDGAFQFYFGGGPQLRFSTVYYDYKYLNHNGNWIDIKHERKTDIDLGVDGVVGLEYTFKEVPLSIFVDANIFIEIIDAPLLVYPQSGFGIRYNIK